MTRCPRRPGASLLLPLLLAGAAPVPAADPGRWHDAWAAAMQPLDGAARVPDAWLANATVRQTVRLGDGGTRLRIRLSNAFGSEPLVVAAVHVARAGGAGAGAGAIDPDSDRAVLFGGRAGVTVPPGGEWLSDPVDLRVAGFATLAVSMRFATPPAHQTGHVASHATSWFAPGDRLSAVQLSGVATAEHWIALAGVEVEGARDVVVALGDSITDGSHSVTDANGRWPDIAGEALAATSARAPVIVNAGIGGNRVLLDGVGPGALARLDRDVLARPGVRAVILLEGINDLGTLTRAGPVGAEAHADLVRRLTDAYRQIVERAHARGIAVYGVTLLPFAGAASYRPDAASLADRVAINRWIRTAGVFDRVIDGDAAMRDPRDPARLAPAFDSGDHLHPSPLGYRRLGDAIAAAIRATGIRPRD